jgi:hypothetical protein
MHATTTGEDAAAFELFLLGAWDLSPFYRLASYASGHLLLFRGWVFIQAAKTSAGRNTGFNPTIAESNAPLRLMSVATTNTV